MHGERTIRFTTTYTKDDDRKGTAAEKRYTAGSQYTMSAHSAAHHVKRGRAEYVGGTGPLASDGAASLVDLSRSGEQTVAETSEEGAPKSTTPATAPTTIEPPSTSVGSQTGAAESPPSSPPARQQQQRQPSRSGGSNRSR